MAATELGAVAVTLTSDMSRFESETKSKVNDVFKSLTGTATKAGKDMGSGLATGSAEGTSKVKEQLKGVEAQASAAGSGGASKFSNAWNGIRGKVGSTVQKEMENTSKITEGGASGVGKKLATVFTGAFIAGIAGEKMTEGFKDVIDAFQNTATTAMATSRAMGTNVHEASEWAFAANESKVGADKFNASMRTLSKQLMQATNSQAAQTDKQKAANAKYAEQISTIRAGLPLIQQHIKLLEDSKKQTANTAMQVDTLKAKYQAQMDKIDQLNGKMSSQVKFSGNASKAFATLGVEYQDAHGKMKPMSEVMDELADKFKAMKDSPQKTALAMQLFGRSAGPDMLKMLNQGSKGLEEMREDADKTGNAIGDKQVAALKANIQAHKDWNKAIEGVKVQLGAQLLPMVTSFFTTMTGKLGPAITRVSQYLSTHQTIIRDTASKIASGLLPVFVGLGHTITQVVVPAVQKVSAFFKEHQSTISALIPRIAQIVLGFMAFQKILGPIGLVVTSFKSISNGLKGVEDASKLANIAGKASDFVKWAGGIGKTVAAFVVQKGAMLASAAASKVMAAGQWLLNAALDANPIGLVVIAIGALVAGFVLAWKNSQTFRNFVIGAWNDIKAVAMPVINWLVSAIGAAWNWITTTTSNVWGGIKSFFVGVWNGMQTAVSTTWNIIEGLVTGAFKFIETVFMNFTGPGLIIGHWNTIKGAFSEAVNWIQKAWTPLWNGIVSVVEWPVKTASAGISVLWDGIKSVFTSVWTWIQKVWSAVWNGLKEIIETPVRLAQSLIGQHITAIRNAFNDLWHWFSVIFGPLWNAVKEIIHNPIQGAKDLIHLEMQGIQNIANGLWTWFSSIFRVLWSGVKSVMSAPVDAAKTAIDNTLNSIKTLFSNAVKAIGSAWDTLEGLFKKPVSFMINTVLNKGLIGGFNWISGKIGGPKIDPVSVPGFKEGGVIPGTFNPVKRDNVLGLGSNGVPTARVEPGEMVVNRRQTQRHFNTLQAINNGTFNQNTSIPNYKDHGAAPVSKFLPALAGGGVAGAVEWAGNQITSHGGGWHERCLAFVNQSWINGGGVSVPWLGEDWAIHAWDAAPGKHPGDANAPAGAAVFFNTGSQYKHITLGLGNGVVASTDWPDGSGHVGAVGIEQLASAWNAPLIGWASPDPSGKADSGFLSKLWGSVKGVVSSVAGWVSAGFSSAKDWLMSKIGGAEHMLTHQFPGNTVAQYGEAAVGKLISSMTDSITSFGSSSGGDSSNTGDPGGSGVTRWTDTVKQALSMNGLPTSDDYVGAWLRQINTESSGNPNAVQGNIGDINNKTGDLAKGLVQVIGATFRAYQFPGHGNIFNGLDNLLAGMNYAKHNYHDMLAVIGHGHGYDSGGMLPPGLTLAINKSGRPEPIFTAGQWDALQRDFGILNHWSKATTSISDPRGASKERRARDRAESERLREEKKSQEAAATAAIRKIMSQSKLPGMTADVTAGERYARQTRAVTSKGLADALAPKARELAAKSTAKATKQAAAAAKKRTRAQVAAAKKTAAVKKAAASKAAAAAKKKAAADKAAATARAAAAKKAAAAAAEQAKLRAAHNALVASDQSSVAAQLKTIQMDQRILAAASTQIARATAANKLAADQGTMRDLQNKLAADIKAPLVTAPAPTSSAYSGDTVTSTSGSGATTTNNYNVNMTVSMQELKDMETIQQFLDMVDNARVTARQTLRSGTTMGG